MTVWAGPGVSVLSSITTVGHNPPLPSPPPLPSHPHTHPLSLRSFASSLSSLSVCSALMSANLLCANKHQQRSGRSSGGKKKKKKSIVVQQEPLGSVRNTPPLDGACCYHGNTRRRFKCDECKKNDSTPHTLLPTTPRPPHPRPPTTPAPISIHLDTQGCTTGADKERFQSCCCCCSSIGSSHSSPCPPTRLWDPGVLNIWVVLFM